MNHIPIILSTLIGVAAILFEEKFFKNGVISGVGIWFIVALLLVCGFTIVKDEVSAREEKARHVEVVTGQEKSTENHLYPDYALKNTDEFWASSVELFFEQPDQLKEHYPEIYAIIKTLLKQDPSTSVSHPCIS